MAARPGSQAKVANEAGGAGERWNSGRRGPEGLEEVSSTPTRSVSLNRTLENPSASPEWIGESELGVKERDREGKKH